MTDDTQNLDDEQAGSESAALARADLPDQPAPRVGARVLTPELALAFAERLLSDVTESVESAALAVGLRPSTVRDAISRYNQDKCKTLADEEVCELVVRAKTEHIKQIRAEGFRSAGKENRAGTSWAQWQLEVQAPREHPRKQEMSVEMAGKNGGPIETLHTVKGLSDAAADALMRKALLGERDADAATEPEESDS